eukprot:Rhum_TRINITY_DN16580_c0_g1::Rhum_TRINITY_DN16580_c0_g1_i1::g.163720::m.163720
MAGVAGVQVEQHLAPLERRAQTAPLHHALHLLVQHNKDADVRPLVVRQRPLRERCREGEVGQGLAGRVHCLVRERCRLRELAELRRDVSGLQQHRDVVRVLGQEGAEGVHLHRVHGADQQFVCLVAVFAGLVEHPLVLRVAGDDVAGVLVARPRVGVGLHEKTRLEPQADGPCHGPPVLTGPGTLAPVQLDLLALALLVLAALLVDGRGAEHAAQLVVGVEVGVLAAEVAAQLVLRPVHLLLEAVRVAVAAARLLSRLLGRRRRRCCLRLALAGTSLLRVRLQERVDVVAVVVVGGGGRLRRRLLLLLAAALGLGLLARGRRCRVVAGPLGGGVPLLLLVLLLPVCGRLLRGGGDVLLAVHQRLQHVLAAKLLQLARHC